MEKLKNLLIVAVVLTAAICCASLLVGSAPAPAYADGEVMAVRVDDGNGNVTDYATFSEAVNTVPDGATITLLEDAVVGNHGDYTFYNKKFALDLNGKVLTNDRGIGFVDSIITIIDSVGTGEFKIDQKFEFAFRSTIFFKSGKITSKDRNLLSACGCTFNMQGGTISGQILVVDGSAFNMTSGLIDKIEVHVSGGISISGGEIDSLLFSNGTKSKVLSGGIVHKISFYQTTPNFAELLQDGYSYTNSATGETIKLSEMNESTSVGFAICAHPSFTGSKCDYCSYVCPHTDFDSATYKCNVCGSYLVASYTDGTNISVYATFADAVASVPDGSTITLLNDAEFCVLENKNITVDLNGKTLRAPSDVSIVGSTLAITDTSSGIGSLLIGGTVTVTSSTLSPIRGSFSTSGGTSKLSLSDDALLEMDSSSVFEVYVPTYVESTSAKVSMRSGLIGGLYVAEYATFEIFDTAEINTLHVFKTQQILDVGAKVHKILFEDGAEQNYRALLPDGYAYLDPNSSSLIKLSAMAENVEIEVVSCPHAGVDEDTNCEYCGKKMYFKVESGPDVFYFDDFDTAVLSLSDGDVMTVLNDFNIPIVAGHKIAKSVTLNLNGKRLLDCGISLESTITVKDDVGGGYILFTCAGGNVSVYGKDNTELKMDYTRGTLKIYGGRIVGLDLYNGHKASEILPSGYAFMNPDENNRKLTWSEAQTASVPLVVGLCDHSEFDEDFVCIYCNQTLDEKTAINVVKARLEAAKTELTEAISKKADAETVNAKLLELESAIKAAKAASETFATDADNDLRKELNGNIATAKDDAIAAANEALNDARKVLEASLAEKASTEYVNGKVSELESAIGNAKTLSETFATDADNDLRKELNGNIATAKDDAIAAANEALNDARKVLEASLSEKASTEYVNGKVSDLETAIGNAKTLSETFATDADNDLRKELNGNIATAKDDAIAAANEALTAAKAELEAKISQNASASELETAIAALNTAISNAETVGKAYTDAKNQALKTELEGSVASAKSEVMAAVAELTERLNSLESSSHKTADNLKTLQTAFIVFTILLSLSVIALAVVLIVWKRRGHLAA